MSGSRAVFGAVMRAVSTLALLVGMLKTKNWLVECIGFRVGLITQRSRVQIAPPQPLTSNEAVFRAVLPVTRRPL